MKANNIIEQIPAAVAERLRVVADRPPAGGDYVLYWMHHAVRGHENPALDAAFLAADSLGAELLVYQELRAADRYASDRHHTFALEGARDARSELEARGVTHALWLERDAEEPSPLAELAAGAALVVTEDFPVPPYPRRLARLAEGAAAPVWVVDTACVVPMRSVDGFHDRAFKFRSAIHDDLERRLTREWEELDASPRRFDPSGLPFSDVDLATTHVADLVASCPIDHTVGPVAHTRGGSIAGYERWRQFRDKGLAAYARRRNDAAASGVSRLSAYLHHGHVSPLRIAREAAAESGKGPEKFLDELIVWRELAHNLCFYRHEEIESLEILPAWARATLADHAGDERRELSWETLARGRTGERLWDLCQTSLLRQGELHNNVRMTWGKALAGWARDPERTLELLIDLNHRYALDGSDPNSYGGLLWCLGLFDRPFQPPQPVLGTVRGRSTQMHAERLDLERYARRVKPPACGEALEVAVIGAGISGLTCARTLADHGHRVRVYDKGRGPGGRMSTRRAGERRFDHGAQYFTARDPRFARYVDSWCEDGVVAPWEGRIAVLAEGVATPKPGDTTRYVGVPGMSALCGHLAADLDVRFSARVAAPERRDGRWHLATEEGEDLGTVDVVVVTAPATQTAKLLEAAAPRLAARAATVAASPCWAAMVSFAEPLAVDFDGAFVEGSPLSWVASDGSKPGRPAADDAWVLHASPEWTREHLELERAEAAERLLEAFRAALGELTPAPLETTHLDAHRWLYALPQALPDPCLFDAELRLAAAGDWCGGPRVEGAFLSGAAAAGRILALTPAPRQAELFSVAATT